MQTGVISEVILFLAIISLALAVWCINQILSLKRRLNDCLGGTKHSEVETALGEYYSRVKTTDAKLDQLTKIHQQLAMATSLASQKISVVRFNPFGDTGGDQSFALAVLDAHDSGYVLTSMHGREGTRVYVKPIDLGKSKYTLSKEERQAIEQATKRVPNQEIYG